MQTIHSFYPLLTQPKKVVITCHQKPDGDAMGSMLGLYHFLIQLGHKVNVISPTNWADFLNWMPGVQYVLDFEAYKSKCLPIIEDAELIFCLDFNIMNRTKNMEQPLLDAKATKVLIDHHQQPETTQFHYGLSTTLKCSTCELVYDFIVESGHIDKINLDVATCLYTGMMTDTGSFRFTNTNASVHRAVAHLKDLGLQHSPIHDHIYESFLENRLRFFGHALLNRLEVMYEHNTTLIYISRQDIKKYEIKTGDNEGLSAYLLCIQGIKFGAIVVDREFERKWSFRSKGGFDVNAFARNHFNGGGHIMASGGSTQDSLETTIKKFKEILPLYHQQLQS